jgi:hypothetical protein
VIPQGTNPPHGPPPYIIPSAQQAAQDTADSARELVVNKVVAGHGPVSITVADNQKIQVDNCKQFYAEDAPLVKGN